MTDHHQSRHSLECMTIIGLPWPIKSTTLSEQPYLIKVEFDDNIPLFAALNIFHVFLVSFFYYKEWVHQIVQASRDEYIVKMPHPNIIFYIALDLYCQSLIN